MDTFHPFWTLFQKHLFQTLCALKLIFTTNSLYFLFNFLFHFFGNHGRGSKPMGNRYGPPRPNDIYFSNVSKPQKHLTSPLLAYCREQNDTYRKYCSAAWLRDHFKSRIISRKCEIQWPPYSPDLSHPDIFLWGYIKDRVYQNKPEIL